MRNTCSDIVTRSSCSFLPRRLTLFLFTTSYWKYNFSFAVLGKSFFAVIGLLWTPLEAWAFFSPEAESIFKELGWQFNTAVVVFAFLWTLLDTRPRVVHTRKHQSIQCDATIHVGDILQYAKTHALVVNSNTQFAVKSGTTSLQAQCVKKYFANDPMRLQAILQAEAGKVASPSSAGEFPIGTTVRIKVENGPILYFVAVATKNPHNKSLTTKDDIQVALRLLWQTLSERGDVCPVALTLFGTGRGMIDVSSAALLNYTLRTFFDACKAKMFCPHLVVMLSQRDFNRGHIDMDDMVRIVDYRCLHG